MEAVNYKEPHIFKIIKSSSKKYPITINGEKTKAYSHWYNLITRCFNLKELEKFPHYKDCYICRDWLQFENFAKWFENDYYEINDELMCLDKDILFKGNKLYSPETCVFVPNYINVIFTKSNKTRGLYPIGVYYEKSSSKYKSQCSYIDNKTGKKYKKNLGRYSTPEKAFEAYKKFKEDYIKNVAEIYKNKIPSKLYNAMYSYIIEIDD